MATHSFLLTIEDGEDVCATAQVPWSVQAVAVAAFDAAVAAYRKSRGSDSLDAEIKYLGNN